VLRLPVLRAAVAEEREQEEERRHQLRPARGDVRQHLGVHRMGRKEESRRRRERQAPGPTLQEEQDQGAVGGVQQQVQRVIAARIEAARCVVERVGRRHEGTVEARLHARLPVVAAEEARHVGEAADEGVLADQRRVVEREPVADHDGEEGRGEGGGSQSQPAGFAGMAFRVPCRLDLLGFAGMAFRVLCRLGFHAQSSLRRSDGSCAMRSCSSAATHSLPRVLRWPAAPGNPLSSRSM